MRPKDASPEWTHVDLAIAIGLAAPQADRAQLSSSFLDASSPRTQHPGATLEVSRRNRADEGGVHHDGWLWKRNGFARMAWNGRAVARPGRTDRVARPATTRQKLTAHWPSCTSSGRTTTWMSTCAAMTAPEASPSSMARESVLASWMIHGSFWRLADAHRPGSLSTRPMSTPWDLNQMRSWSTTLTMAIGTEKSRAARAVNEQGVGTLTWPPAGTYSWPPAGTFSWPWTRSSLHHPPGVQQQSTAAGPLFGDAYGTSVLLSRAQRPFSTTSLVVRDEEAAGSNPVTPTSATVR
jgi:hypothetical protein